MIYLKIKRIVDIILSFIGLIILLPLLIILSIAIKFNSKGPVFFKQKRIGINRTTFNIYKFRTMKIDAPQNMPTHELENPDQYITKIGKYLRKTSMDELPQLINILKGEMSFIGPRPVICNEVDLIRERDKYGANDIIPGLTGLAQINGRDTVNIIDKARYDGDYKKNLGIKMDIYIFFISILIVIKRTGFVEGQIESVVTNKNNKNLIKKKVNESDSIKS